MSPIVEEGDKVVGRSNVIQASDQFLPATSERQLAWADPELFI